MTHLTAKMKEARLSAGYSLKEMADEVGLNSKQHMHAIERGWQKLPLSVLRRVMEVTGMKLDFFIDGRGVDQIEPELKFFMHNAELGGPTSKGGSPK